MTKKEYGPLSGLRIFESISGKKTIIMAANTRITTVAKGIFEKRQKILILPYLWNWRGLNATSTGGTHGLTPKDFSEKMNEAAQDAQCDIWALHADHITIKTESEQEIDGTKLISTPRLRPGIHLLQSMPPIFLILKEKISGKNLIKISLLQPILPSISETG